MNDKLRKRGIVSFCSQCGTEQNQGAKFCISCGAPQQSTEPERAISKSSSLDELASRVINTYLEVKSDDNFDPESITEEILQG